MAAIGDFAGWPTLIGSLLRGDDLDGADAAAAMRTILVGDATDAQIAGFVVALRAKGERPAELDAMLSVVLEAAETVPLDDDERAAAIDVVGTGGDGEHTINVSTMAALVAAGAGAPVCKHGNRSASSKCGTADVLELLGVTLEQQPADVARAMRETGIGFCFAPAFHPAFRFAGPPRREIGVPSVFNLLGPMANPGQVRRQVIGVADPRYGDVMIEVLRRQGLTRAWVVHGAGLDELTTAGESMVWALEDGRVTTTTIVPADAGLPPATLDQLRGGSPHDNAEIVRRVLEGDPGPHRDIVVLNAAAALVVAGLADDLRSGAEVSAAAIDDGRAAAALDGLVRASTGA
jgi:anthranilate phosphoribosyltransferase